MIKKVARIHMLQYLLHDRPDQTLTICTTDLHEFIQNRFKFFTEETCFKLALYLTQPDDGEDEV
jgi:hypothetical protein